MQDRGWDDGVVLCLMGGSEERLWKVSLQNAKSRLPTPVRARDQNMFQVFSRVMSKQR